MKNKKVNFLIFLLLVIFTLGLVACLNNKENSNSTQNSRKVQELKKKAKNSSGIKFIKKEMDKNFSVSFNTSWKSNENGNYSACIEGKGNEALEEGIGKIIVKGPQKIYSLEIENNDKLSPKYLEWADNKNLLVVIGYSAGSVSKGGDLYILNVDTGHNEILIKMPNKKEQIISVEKNGNAVNLKVNVYDDNIYNKCHVEKWIINSFNVNLNNRMEVKNSSGKVVYVING